MLVGLMQAARLPAPVRDTPPVERAGSAVVRGRVRSAADDHPLSNARIVLTSPDVRARNEPVFTDGNGRFEIRQLPAGRYNITVTKAGYVLGRFGARNDVDRPIPFDLADGAALDGLDFHLLKAGAISGRIVDDLGDPVLAAPVSAGRLERVNRELRMTTMRGTVTDDLGEYRIGDLTAGTYVVQVQGNRENTFLPGAPDEWRRAIGWSTIFYPAAATITAAERLTMGVGEEISGIDLVLRPTQSTRLAITATDASGNPATGLLVMRGQDSNVAIPLHEGGTASMALDPGIFVAWNPGAPSGGMSRVTIAPGDTSLNVRLSKAGRITGRITVEGGAAADASKVPVGLRSVVDDLVPNGPAAPNAPFPMSVVNPDGTFEAANLFGSVEFFLRGAPSDFALKSVTHDGRNVLDSPIEFGGGEEMTDVQVVITTRTAEVDGSLVDSQKAPAVGCSAIIFPDDAEAIRSARLTRWVRSDLNGRLRIAGLLPGTYFVTAIRHVDPIDWSTPEYLASLRPRATRVTLTGGEKKPLTVACGDVP